MFADPQFWVAVSFVLFIAVIFNPVRKILISSLDVQIKEIKSKIDEAENLKNEAQKTLSELKKREAEVEKVISKVQNINEIDIVEKHSLKYDKKNFKDDSKSIFFDIFFSHFVITFFSEVSLKISIISNSNEIG